MYPTDPVAILGLWVAMILMLMVYSYPLFKENPLYRFAEHTFIGTSLAIAVITAIQTTNRTAVQPMLSGNYIFIIPIILGISSFFVLSGKYRWISRYSTALLIGAALGLGMRGVIISQILSQIINTITVPKNPVAMDWFNFLYISIGTILAIMYFIMSFEHKGLLKYPATYGRYFIMIGLGGMFGNTLLGRMTMIAGRAQFLLQVLGLIPM